MIKVRCRAWWGLAYNTRWTHGLTRSQANAGALVGRKRNLKLGITTLGRFRGFREPRTPQTLLSFSSTQSLHFLSSANVLLSTKETYPVRMGRQRGHTKGDASILVVLIMAETVWSWNQQRRWPLPDSSAFFLICQRPPQKVGYAVWFWKLLLKSPPWACSTGISSNT